MQLRLFRALFLFVFVVVDVVVVASAAAVGAAVIAIGWFAKNTGDFSGTRAVAAVRSLCLSTAAILEVRKEARKVTQCARRARLYGSRECVCAHKRQPVPCCFVGSGGAF
jgi:hypothetical protein